MRQSNRYRGYLAFKEQVRGSIVLVVVVTVCIAPGAELRGA